MPWAACREKPEVETPEAYLSLFGQIPKFDKLIATIRSRAISASIILQSQSQLQTIYKDAADTIVGNCDCTLFQMCIRDRYNNCVNSK